MITAKPITSTNTVIKMKINEPELDLLLAIQKKVNRKDKSNRNLFGYSPLIK